GDKCINPETILCGSEGTLAIVVGATLRLTPLPRHRGLVVAHFDDLLESLAATPAILEHSPAAIELLDRLVLDAALSQPAMARRATMIEGRPAALLVIELFDDNASALSRRLSDIETDLRDRRIGTARPILTDAKRQEDIWAIRRSGLGLLMSRPGDAQPYAFVEDTAVHPSRLRNYIARFAAILEEEGVEQAGYYAHASVGCLHVRPVLNLRNATGVERMRRIADHVSSLALEFGGTMTGEHGDGIVRSGWLEKLYGRRIIEAFGRIKRAFDPAGILNPGKIVSPMSMTEHLRYSALPTGTSGNGDASTALDFSAHGGLFGLANMCSGVGQCRQRLVGTMCPSYMATGDERDTTRARANALRLALSNGNLLNGLSDPALDEVMDLCLGCKACKTECPTGVDMARLKAEWLHRRHADRRVPLRSRLVAALPALAAAGSLAPGLANAMIQSGLVRALGERLFGLDRRVRPPRLARRTFRRWFATSRSHRLKTGATQSGETGVTGSGESGATGGSADDDDRPPVVYFVDTWTNFFAPEIGIAAVRVLEALGYRVIVPPTACCGRPAISQGLLDRAARMAETNVSILAEHAVSGIPIVGTEPSCLLTLVDELPQLVRTTEARRIAEQAVMIETFAAKTLRQASGQTIRAGNPDAILWRRFPTGADPQSQTCTIGMEKTASDDSPKMVYHGHCHQKALVGTEDAMAVLQWAAAGRASEINSGCCGMAGAFGHEAEHYDVARAIGEQRLFPAVRNRGNATIVVSGFSCRQQIEHHTSARPRHVIEILAEKMTNSEKRLWRS
ncbi:MAG: FAD-binding and (Fe-S)-binding domain-containing protein, partial [Phycisphaerae bacterium]